MVSVSAGNATKDTQIENTGGGRTIAGFEHAAIVGEASSGSVIIDGLYGPTSHSYINQTEAIVQGTPGATITLAPGGFFTPNAEPIMHLAMNGLDAVTNSLPGEWGTLGATIIGDVSLDASTAFTLPGQSLRFNGGHLMVTPDASLDIGDDLFVNLRFRLPEAGAVVGLPSDSSDEWPLIRKGDGVTEAWSLKVDSSGHLVASITTDSGSYSVQSTQTVERERWYIGGLRIRAGGLELGLNEERAATPISGKLLGAGTGIAVAGSDFRGHIDDVKLGRESLADALVTFGDGSLNTSITFGADGTARVPIQATGLGMAKGQVVGLSQVGASGITQQPKEGPWYADLLIDTFSTVLGVKTVYADEVAGAQEAGVAVSKKADWGYVAEWAGEHVFGSAWDKVKTVAEFVYQLTSVSDIVTLLKAVVNLAKGNTEDIDGFEVTFAAISIGATAIAIFTSGGAAIGPIKGGLTAIKPILKELFETGIKDAIKVGVITGKFMFRKIKDFIDNPGKSLDELSDFGAGLVDVVSDTSGKALTYFFNTVRSLDDMIDWVKGYKFRNVCLGYSVQGSGDVLYARAGVNGELFIEKRLSSSIKSVLAEAFLGSSAHAADVVCPGINTTQKLMDLATDSARFGGDAVKAYKVAKSVRKALRILDDAGIVLNSQRSVDVLADIAHHGGRDALQKFAINAAKKWEKTYKKDGVLISVKLDVTVPGRMDQLLGVIGDVPTSSESYQRWIRGLHVDNTSAIKGIYGEAKSLPHVKTAYGYTDDITPKLADLLENGQQGVDIELPSLTIHGKVFDETKVRKAGSDTHENVLKLLENQYRKHLTTKIMKELDATTGKFKEGKIPILHYEVGGSFFSDGFRKKMLERFQEILNKEFKRLKKAGFSFEESNVHFMGSDDIMN